MILSYIVFPAFAIVALRIALRVFVFVVVVVIVIDRRPARHCVTTGVTEQVFIVIAIVVVSRRRRRRRRMMGDPSSKTPTSSRGYKNLIGTRENQSSFFTHVPIPMKRIFTD
jgi:hypothetical protein